MKRVLPGPRPRVSGVAVAASICKLYSDPPAVEVLPVHLSNSIGSILLALNLVVRITMLMLRLMLMIMVILMMLM